MRFPTSIRTAESERRLLVGPYLEYNNRLMYRFVRALIFICAAVSSASAESLRLPAVGGWNGFLRHVNVLECTNASGTRYDYTVTVRSNSGTVLGTQSVSLPPFGSFHLSLNAYNIENAYGTFRIDHISGAPQTESPLNCSTLVYRFPSGAATRAIEYGFALPVQNSLTGRSAGVFNSFNPGSGAQPVHNWLSVYNPGSSPFNANVEIFDQDGAFDPAASFSVDGLQPGERRDIALGHPLGQRVGLYRINPADASAPYGAYVTRYSVIGPDRYNFAFPVFARGGLCEPGPIPASTMDPAMNWGEIANPTDAPISTLVEIRDALGRTRSSENITLPPRSQRHVYINAALGDKNVGTFHVRCNPSFAGAALLVDSAYYGFRFNPAPVLEWGYVSQGFGNLAFESDRISVPINTYLGAANWTKFLDAGQTTSTLNFSLYNLPGRNVGGYTSGIFANGGVDLGIHENVGTNFAGQQLAYTNTPGSVLAGEVLRVFPDNRGGLGYIFNIPPRVVPADPSHLGPVRASIDGPFFEFRGKKMVIVGDSITEAWMELGTDFNTTGYLDHLQSRGINALMIWSYIGVIDQTTDPRIGYHAPRLWPWVETSGRVTPPYTFQLVGNDGRALLNDNYFTALRGLVEGANARDILVLITVHDGWTKRRFEGHPMNIANGGAIGVNSDYVTLANYSAEMPDVFNPLWGPYEKHQFHLEGFSDRLIRATSDFPNVIYEMMNEGEWYDGAKLKNFELFWLNFFRARTDQPLVVNDTSTLNNDFWSIADVDSVAYHSPNWGSGTRAVDVFRSYAERRQSSGGRPVLFDEPVPEYRGGDVHLHNGLMRLIWGTVLGGAGFFAQNDIAWQFPDGANDAVFTFLSAAANFMNNLGIPIGEMAPAGNLSSNGICMASAGKHYVVYTQAGAMFTLNLAGQPGNYEVRYFPPRTGVFDPTVVPVSGGGTIVVTPPSGDDWVVWVKRVS